MNLQQQQSVLTIAMLAAFADGAKDDTEREEIRRIAQSLAAEGNMPDLPRLYQDVLLRRTSLESAAAALQDPTHRQLAYEMAVCVCDVDGRQTPTEREFLAHLKQTLQLGGAATAAFDQEEQALLNALDGATATTATTPGLPVPVPAAVPSGPSAAAVQRDAELDKSILNYALLNGALELLPQSWASMAIIPLQIKMVHAIGLAHGVEPQPGWAWRRNTSSSLAASCWVACWARWRAKRWATSARPPPAWRFRLPPPTRWGRWPSATTLAGG